MTAGTADSAEAAAADRGAQPERTRMAWRRTTLAFTVAVLLAVRGFFEGSGGAPAAVATAAVLLVWPAFLVTAHRRIRQLAEQPMARAAPAAGGALLSAALWTVALAALGAVLLA